MKRFLKLKGNKNIVLIAVPKISNIGFNKKQVFIYLGNSVMFPLKIPRTPENEQKLKDELGADLEGLV